MELYRLSKEKYQHDVKGTGAFNAGGRWNSKGVYMLYTAGSRSLALVESLAHLTSVNHLEPYVLLVLYLPDDASRLIQTHTTLQPDWRKDSSYTQSMGDHWAGSHASLLLQVPSAILPKEYNYLINPLHPEASALKIIEVETFSFDARLK